MSLLVMYFILIICRTEQESNVKVVAIMFFSFVWQNVLLTQIDETARMVPPKEP